MTASESTLLAVQVRGKRREPAPHPPDWVLVPAPRGRKQTDLSQVDDRGAPAARGVHSTGVCRPGSTGTLPSSAFATACSSRCRGRCRAAITSSRVSKWSRHNASGCWQQRWEHSRRFHEGLRRTAVSPYGPSRRFSLQALQCAQGDSNSHPAYTGQGPQPDRPSDRGVRTALATGVCPPRETIWTDMAGRLLSRCCHGGPRASR